MPATTHLLRYARRIRDLRRAHAAVSEPALAPAFQELLESLLADIPGAPGLVVVPEYNNPGVGRPDIALKRPGAPARAFVELKALDKAANPTRWRVAHDKRQFERLKELRCWGACNFIELFLFESPTERGKARVVPEQALDPDRADAAADRLIRQHNAYRRDAEPALRSRSYAASEPLYIPTHKRIVSLDIVDIEDWFTRTSRPFGSGATPRVKLQLYARDMDTRSGFVEGGVEWSAMRLNDSTQGSGRLFVDLKLTGDWSIKWTGGKFEPLDLARLGKVTERKRLT